MAQTGIFGLRAREDTPALDVRVLRKWVPDHRSNELHYLFVDAEGGAIQAVVKGDERSSLQSKLKEGMCYNLDGYVCTDTDEFTSVVTHPAMMHIGKASIFTPIPDTADIQKEYYEFATRRGLEAQSLKTWGIIDYIGICQKLKDGFTKDNKPYIIMFLRDNSNRDVSVALWSNIITSPSRFNRAQIEGAEKPAIVGLTALKAHNYEGTLQLKSTNATYVYLNPNAIETTQLIKLYETEDITISTSTAITENVTSLSHILQLPDDKRQGKTFTVNGCIADLQSYKDWFYAACPICNQLAYPKRGIWYCTRDSNLKKAVHLYKIYGTITDTTGSIDAVFFDRATAQLLNKSCEQMVQAENSAELLQEIVDKDAQFTIQIQKDKKLSNVSCIVNRACFLGDKTEEEASASTTPSTPAPKQVAAKRSLTLTPDPDTAAAKGKLPRTSTDD